MLTINGAFGEGGGQIIRTTLTLAALLGQPVRLENIRAGRKNPGLAAQHLTAVWAAAQLCAAEVVGADLGSTELTFVPNSPPQAGWYEFDVAQARPGGSAGAATLVLQTILLPLCLATTPSHVHLRGGTHVPWSPSFHYIQEVYLPMVAQLGFTASVSLEAWGWYPAGEGEINLEVPGRGVSDAPENESLLRLSQTGWAERGALQAIRGVAVASSLPAHIAQRMQQRASKLLEQAGWPVSIEPQRVRSTSPGAGLFLVAEYDNCRAGFGVLGKKGKTSEQVAEEAVAQVLAFQQSQAVLDHHLADQLILPLALTGQAFTVSVQAVSTHTLTNLGVVEQFLGPVATINREQNQIEFHQREPVL
jgi:RNA 3'-terminal phosphate cyclase (ATP)